MMLEKHKQVTGKLPKLKKLTSSTKNADQICAEIENEPRLNPNFVINYEN